MGVQIPYYGADGRLVAKRYRKALGGKDRFRWGRGTKVLLYGLDLLRDLSPGEPIVLVEGESDCWTARYHGLCGVLGIPGKGVWRAPWAEYFKGHPVFLWMEPDAEDLAHRIGADIPDLRVIRAPEGIKDLSEAHLKGISIPPLLKECMRTAVPVVVIPRSKFGVGAIRPASSTWTLRAVDASLQDEILRLVKTGGGIRQVFLPVRFFAMLPAVGSLLHIPIDAQLRRKIACPLHRDQQKNSADLRDNSNGTVVLKCWHTGKIWTIPDLYHLKVTGLPRHLVGREHRIWGLRLLMDSGIIPRPHVALPPLPRLVSRPVVNWARAAG